MYFIVIQLGGLGKMVGGLGKMSDGLKKISMFVFCELSIKEVAGTLKVLSSK